MESTLYVDSGKPAAGSDEYCAGISRYDLWTVKTYATVYVVFSIVLVPYLTIKALISSLIWLCKKGKSGFSKVWSLYFAFGVAQFKIRFVNNWGFCEKCVVSDAELCSDCKRGIGEYLDLKAAYNDLPFCPKP
ncbi:MAG: hypothetical protein LBI69_03065 [Puniceicoccales bacterium]|jgi:hypothetical protein|nr:hypothetical protein [Puniceicoccales bacterium]